jgi:hypothetical protein
MDDAGYQKWRRELDAWLAAHAADEPALEVSGGPLARAAALVLAQARLAARGLDATQPRAQVADRNRYDHLAGRLEELLAFAEFSLAEYTIHLPAQSPGVRLWYQRAGGARITLVMFPDVRVWRVDAAGRKKSETLLTLWLEQDGPVPEPPATTPAGPQPGRDWRWELVDALCLPVRRFLE